MNLAALARLYSRVQGMGVDTSALDKFLTDENVDRLLKTVYLLSSEPLDPERPDTIRTVADRLGFSLQDSQVEGIAKGLREEGFSGSMLDDFLQGNFKLLKVLFTRNGEGEREGDFVQDPNGEWIFKPKPLL
jgi:hypothetical protein